MRARAIAGRQCSGRPFPAMVLSADVSTKIIIWLGCLAIIAASKKLFCRHCGAEITDHNYHVHLASQPNAQVL